jgi:hypothetical protein
LQTRAIPSIIAVHNLFCHELVSSIRRVVTRCRAPLAHAIVIVGQYRFLLPFRVDDDDSFQRGRAALIFGVRFCVLKSAARDAFVKQPPELVGVDGLYKVMIEPGLDRVLVIAR